MFRTNKMAMEKRFLLKNTVKELSPCLLCLCNTCRICQWHNITPYAPRVHWYPYRQAQVHTIPGRGQSKELPHEAPFR